MLALFKYMIFYRDSMRHQCAYQKQGILHRYCVISKGMPYKGLGSVLIDTVFQRKFLLFAVILFCQQVSEGSFMSKRTGGDHRITKDHGIWL